MKKLRFVANIFYYLIFISLVLIVLTATASALNIPQGFKLYTVQTNSMSPAIKAGSLVIVKPAPEYLEKDIITFKEQKDRLINKPKNTITHRIVKIEEVNGQTFFTTKGDANDAPDTDFIDKDLIIGRVNYSFAYFGYPIAFAKTPVGLIFLVVIPATIIIYSEIMVIKKQIKKMKDKKQKK